MSSAPDNCCTEEEHAQCMVPSVSSNDSQSVSITTPSKEIAEFTDSNNSCSSDSLVKGLSTMLATIIRDFDARAEDTFRSQDQLSCALDRLTKELDQLLEDAPIPFIMQHAAKISGVRKRVSSLNSLLKSIQKRIDNMDRMLSVGLAHGKSSAESSGQH